MTRLIMRVETASGPRIIISQDLSVEMAWDASNALESLGVQTHITEDATPIPMKALIRRRKKDNLKTAVTKDAESNVTALPVKGRENARREISERK